jgi:hypothetical protein
MPSGRPPVSLETLAVASHDPSWPDCIDQTPTQSLVHPFHSLSLASYKYHSVLACFPVDSRVHTSLLASKLVQNLQVDGQAPAPDPLARLIL